MGSSGPGKTVPWGKSWPQLDSQTTGSFLLSIVELHFLSIPCVRHFSKWFACVHPDRNHMGWVPLLVLISQMEKLRHRAVKLLSQGHRAKTAGLGVDQADCLWIQSSSLRRHPASSLVRVSRDPHLRPPGRRQQVPSLASEPLHPLSSFDSHWAFSPAAKNGIPARFPQLECLRADVGNKAGGWETGLSLQRPPRKAFPCGSAPVQPANSCPYWLFLRAPTHVFGHSA